MKIRILTVIVLLVAFGAGWYLWLKPSQDKSSEDKEQETLSLALDWTPNTNHTGIYVAQQKGWYKEQGIDLKILPYSPSTTTDVLVSSEKADVGIGFTEGIVSSNGAGSPVVSIAAVIAHNTSAIAVLKDSGITSPKQLEGKTFGGFGAPYEKAAMSQVIKNDGGRGDFKNFSVSTDPLTALKNKSVDFVWIFTGWEGIQAKREGIEITTFDLRDYGIPDYSTPNIISSPETIEKKREALKRFMAATAKGYEFARQNPDEAARILIDTAPPQTFADEELVRESQRYLSPLYQDEGKDWGVQEPDFWRKYPQFMLENQAVTDSSGKPVGSLDFDSLFTNEFLP
jgi:ABC-type nitrate/sulfonate/bicarbonate transport system substrate-binding protein